MRAHVLLLAGTAEARQIAAGLDHLGLRVTVSLAGVTRAPAPLVGEVRTGGFGGSKGLAAWLAAERVIAVIDATHPYAARMQANAVAACEAALVPRLRVLRPPWRERPGWQVVPSVEAGAAALPARARALVTVGRSGAGAFAARTDCRVLLRAIEPTPDLPPHMTQILARPPFRKADEVALMRGHAITHLVTKNAGGPGTAKLDAAETLRLQTVVVARPAPPPGPIVEAPGAAVAWLRQTVGN